MPLTHTDQHNWYASVALTSEQTLALEAWVREDPQAAPICLVPLLREIHQWRLQMPDVERYAPLAKVPR